MRFRCFAFVLAFLCLSIVTAAFAQEKIGDEENVPDETVVPIVKVAVIPFVMIDESKPCTNKDIVGKVDSVTTELLHLASMQRVDELAVEAKWKTIRSFDEESAAYESLENLHKALPKPTELLRLGQELGVNYVVVANLRWHSYSVWVDFG